VSAPEAKDPKPVAPTIVRAEKQFEEKAEVIAHEGALGYFIRNEDWLALRNDLGQDRLRAADYMDDLIEERQKVARVEGLRDRWKDEGVEQWAELDILLSES
jgi:hypothetical protein